MFELLSLVSSDFLFYPCRDNINMAIQSIFKFVNSSFVQFHMLLQWELFCFLFHL